MRYSVREYTPGDEGSWLRCRVLSFLGTPFYDDVDPAKPAIAAPGLELVAVDASGAVVAIMDTEVRDDRATIDTAAVHPDHQRRGLGRRLLERTRATARMRGARVLEAWTLDDPDTLSWYRAMGFSDSDHYLHVFADRHIDGDDALHAAAQPRPGLRPVASFFHADLREEERLRKEFARVHVCRRFSMPL